MKKYISIYLRIIKYISLTIIAIGTAWALYNLKDTELDPKAAAFFNQPVEIVKDEENGLVALAGINAPEGVDVIEYSKKISALNAEPDKNAISYKGRDNWECWIVQKQNKITNKNNQPCPSKQELLQALQDNKILLERYAALHKYKRFIDTSHYPDKDNRLNPDTITLNELYLAKLALLVEQGKSEEAMEGWLANTYFLQNMVSEQQDMLKKSILFVLFGDNERFLPVIIEKQPNVAKTYYSELQKILSTKAFGGGGWDIAATMRAQYNFIKEMEEDVENPTPSREAQATSIWAKFHNYIGEILYGIFYKSNDTANSFYRYAQDMSAISNVISEKEYYELYKRMEAKYSDQFTLQDFLYNPIGNLILDGLFVGKDIIRARHYQVVYLKMLGLYIEAKNRDIPASEMEIFIKNSDKKFYNIITNQPFLWDKATNSIYHEFGNRKIKVSIFY